MKEEYHFLPASAEYPGKFCKDDVGYQGAHLVIHLVHAMVQTIWNSPVYAFQLFYGSETVPPLLLKYYLRKNGNSKLFQQEIHGKYILYLQMLAFPYHFFRPNLPLPLLNTPKTNMDTQNDALKKVAPFKYGHLSYLCEKFLVGKPPPFSWEYAKLSSFPTIHPHPPSPSPCSPEMPWVSRPKRVVERSMPLLEPVNLNESLGLPKRGMSKSKTEQWCYWFRCIYIYRGVHTCLEGVSPESSCSYFWGSRRLLKTYRIFIV